MTDSDKKRHKIRGRVEEGIIYFLILFMQNIPKRQIFIESESRLVVAEGWLEECGNCEDAKGNWVSLRDNKNVHN